MTAKKLVMGDFRRFGERGSLQHYFEAKFPDGSTICLEACLSGYCVAKYDKNQQIIGEKHCTKVHELLEEEQLQRFSLRRGAALQKAVEIANTL